MDLGVEWYHTCSILVIVILSVIPENHLTRSMLGLGQCIRSETICLV